MALTEDERKRAIEYALNGAQFQFLPSQRLVNMVSKGSSETEDVNVVFRIMIMKKEPIRLQTSMIMKYCKHKLDRQNTWLLDQGDIKVIPRKFEIKEKTDE
jgi:hypothetical protein